MFLIFDYVYKTEITYGDIVAVCFSIFGTIISILALIITYRYAKSQIEQNDRLNSATIALNIQIEMQNIWREFHKSDKKENLIVDILNIVEYVADLYWRNIITVDNSPLLLRAIEDQLFLIVSNEHANRIFIESHTAEDAFVNLRKFKARFVDDRIKSNG
ncbi:MAG: hypothetical protein IOC64_13965 [Methylobacterium sp.]|jgi:hypothetical protein|nr:hypothetical protein [Methylobacterium sp.]MCA3607819.1 hypothetical protein [Methylobacterium sp.]MCA3609129.1 hypothetical protein [Methylobacterium sp.]MCA3617561.1 hypothetical protein [Methylobacterium sp.]MCA3620002.1 hypothetical protein [Methylobacterium sp.]